MTQSISHFSRHQDAAVNIKEGKYQYTGKDQQNAEIKIRRFYNLTIGTLIVVATALFVVTNLAQEPNASQSKGQPQSALSSADVTSNKGRASAETEN